MQADIAGLPGSWLLANKPTLPTLAGWFPEVWASSASFGPRGSLLTDQVSTFEQGLLGCACRVKRREADWVFSFSNSRIISVECRWRIVSPKGIALADEDHGQKFGLPSPVDAEERANALLRDAEVTSAKIDRTTADFSLSFSNGRRLGLINNSSSYEAWNAGLIIALGGGGLALF